MKIESYLAYMLASLTDCPWYAINHEDEPRLMGYCKMCKKDQRDIAECWLRVGAVFRHKTREKETPNG